MTTITYNYTGAAQTFTWPAGVASLTFDVQGSAGQGYDDPAGGFGGRVQGTLAKGGESTLQVIVGTAAGTGCGSGAAVGQAGAGGGYSDVRQGGTALSDRQIVAGAGGGNRGNGGTDVKGGAGGNTTGGNGNSGVNGGKGGTPSAGGAPGVGGVPAATAGDTIAVGTGGTGGGTGGGGGGGGYHGGGGGSEGGGGGGSSYTGANSSAVTHTQGYNGGAGSVSFTYVSAPAAPTLGTITPGNAQLSAAFTAGSDGGSAITSYKYSTDNGATYRTRQTGTTASPIVITTLSSDGTTPLTNGTSYTVLIKAVNAVGDGTASNSVAATPSTTPSAPTLGTITPSSAQLSAAFTAGGTGGSSITTYKYSTDNGATYRTRQTGTTASPIVITTLSSDGTTPLVNGTPYTVIIKAVNANGDGAASNAVTATPATTPSAPTALVATGGNAQVSVAFTAGATGGSAITSYKYSTDNGSTFRTRQTGTTASPVVITTLSSDGTTPLVNGNTYQIQLKAVNAIGDGTASAAVSGTPVAPSIPKNLLLLGVG